MADRSLNLKTNFSVESKLEAFFTGGPIQLNANGNHIFCSCGGQVKVVNSSTGKVDSTIASEEDTITNFVLSPNNKVLVTYSLSGLLRQISWPENTIQRVWKSTHKGPINVLTFDSTTTLLATGGSDSTIKVWDIIQQYCTHNLKGSQGVFSTVEFHPDISKLLIFGAADDYSIRGWNLKTSEVCCVLQGHFSKVTSLAFTASGKEMLSSGRDQIIIIWNIETFVSLRTFPVYETVETVFVLPPLKPFPEIGADSKTAQYFVTSGSKGVLRVWTFGGHLVHTQKDVVAVEQCGIAISRAFLNLETEKICLITSDHNIMFYHLENFALDKQLVGYNDEILDLCYFGKKGQYLAVATNSLDIKIFNAETFSTKLLKGHTDIVLSLDCFAKSPQILASCSKDNSVRLWNMNSDGETTCVAIGTGHTHSVGSVAVSKLSTKFLVTGSEDRCLKLWDVPQNIVTDQAEFSKPLSLNVKWTVISHDKDVNFVTISPNDKLIATASQDKSVKIWSSSEGKCLANLKGHRRGVWCVQFSPFDQIVASGSADGIIKLWSLSDFACVMTFEGHECSVLRVVFMSRGMQMLSSASDGLIKLWTIKSNECLKTFDGHDNKVWALQVNESESHFISGGGDSNIIIWKDVSEIEKEEEMKKREDLILQEQELSNLIQKKDYFKALALTLTMEQPFRALNIITEILYLPDGEVTFLKTFEQFRPDQIDCILRFAVSWNQNSKHCKEAQTVVNLVLKTMTTEELLALPNIRSNLEGLIPYTERHCQRTDRLLQQATFIDYTWRKMKMACEDDQAMES
ncbi:Transducin (beta)-like 3 [Chamberlinius hualienensis]